MNPRTWWPLLATGTAGLILVTGTAATAGPVVPFDTGRLPTVNHIVRHPDYDETVRVGRTLLRCPTGTAVLFHKDAQVTFGSLAAADNEGAMRSYATIDDFFAEDPARARGAGVTATVGAPWTPAVNATAGDRMRFLAAFNCHGFALAGALGERRSWVEGPGVEAILSSYYELVRTVVVPTEMPAIPANDAAAEARIRREFRRDFLRAALELARGIDENTTELSNGMIVSLAANPATGRHFAGPSAALAHVHSGRLHRLDTAWGVMSKLGEASPVVLTSLTPLLRVYAGQFNEVRFYRLRGTGPRSGVVAAADLAAAGARFRAADVEGAALRISVRSEGRPAWSRSAFFISADGYFLTTYDALRGCFEATRQREELSRVTRCEQNGVTHTAHHGGREYPVSVVSHLTAAASATTLGGAGPLTLTGILDDKFFVVGKVTLPADARVPFLRLSAPAAVPERPAGPLLPFGNVLPKAFFAGFNDDGAFRTAVTEFSFLDARGRALVSGTQTVLVGLLAAPADRARLSTMLTERFPQGMGDGVTVAVTLQGAPSLGADGEVKGILVFADPAQALGVVASRNAVLDAFFTRTRPATPLLTIRVGDADYWLRD